MENFPPYTDDVTKHQQRLLIFGILLLATFARTWQITTLPGGLFPDQAANGEDALAILHGDLRPFYERGNGREALFFYLQATLIAIFGIKVWPMFLASALVGIGTVWATVAAGRRLFGTRAALFAALFLATNQWHVTISRTGFRAVLVPLFIALTLFFAAGVVRARTRPQRRGEALGAGVSYGLGWYSYIAYRAFTPVLCILGALLCIRECLRRPRFLGLRRYGRSLALAFIAAGLTALPLAWYFGAHPDAFLGRAGHVSVFNPDLNEGDVVGTVTTIVKRSLLAFITRGDLNPRHNVPGFPFLSPLPATFLLVGLVVAARRALRHLHQLFVGRPSATTLPSVLILLLALFMLVPAVVTAEGIPHGLRSIGEIPAVFWLAGIGAAFVLDRVRQFPSLSARRFTKGLLAALLVGTAVYDLALYFGVSASSPRFWYEYRSDLTTVTDIIRERARNRLPPPYLALDDFSVQTVHFLTTDVGYAYRLVRPEQSDRIQLAGPSDVIMFTQSSLPDADRYLRGHPDVTEVDRRTNQFGETTVRVMGLRER